MTESSSAEPAVEVISNPLDNLYDGDNAVPSTPTPQRRPRPLLTTPDSHESNKGTTPKRPRPHTPKDKSPSATPSKSRLVGRRSQGAARSGSAASSPNALNLNSDNRLKHYGDSQRYPYQCPICMRRFGERGGEEYLKSHVWREIDLWQYLFYDVDGIDLLEPEDVKHHGCGICSEKAAWDTKEKLLEHVVDCHCTHKHAMIQSQESYGVAETNTSPPLPAKMTWDFSTVFESLLKHDRLKIEAYRPSKHGNSVVAFLWPRTKQTLQIFKILQEGSWLRYDELATRKFVEQASDLATHRIYSSGG